MTFNDSFEELMSLYAEAKEAPKGKHYDKAGRLQSGDADADGDGGPKFRSDPTYKNPNEDGEEKKRFTLFPKGKSTNVGAILGREEQGEKVKDGKAQGPDSKEEKSEDNETAKKVAKTVGKAALGAAKLAGKGALKAGKELGHFVTDDQFRSKRKKVEDCETCGCEENPEYGHFDDKFSDYIDQYEAEDAERVDKDRMK